MWSLTFFVPLGTLESLRERWAPTDTLSPFFFAMNKMLPPPRSAPLAGSLSLEGCQGICRLHTGNHFIMDSNAKTQTKPNQNYSAYVTQGEVKRSPRILPYSAWALLPAHVIAPGSVCMMSILLVDS